MNKVEHLLTKLIQECAEIQQIATKAQLFGLNSGHPKHTTTNAEELKLEINDLLAVKSLLGKYVDISEDERLTHDARRSIDKWMQHSINLGITTAEETILGPDSRSGIALAQRHAESDRFDVGPGLPVVDDSVNSPTPLIPLIDYISKILTHHRLLEPTYATFEEASGQMKHCFEQYKIALSNIRGDITKGRPLNARDIRGLGSEELENIDRYGVEYFNRLLNRPGYLQTQPELLKIHDNSETAVENDLWEVLVLGEKCTENFEISVIRKSNEHGRDSWGRFCKSKLLICDSGGPCHTELTEKVWDKMIKLAAEVVNELNHEEFGI